MQIYQLTGVLCGFYRKHRAASGFATTGNGISVSVGELFGDCEAETVTRGVCAGSGGIGAVETVKDARLIFFADADAMVVYGDDGCTALDIPCDSDIGLRGRVLDGVIEQDEEYLLKHCRVCRNGLRWSGDGDGAFFSSSKRLDTGDCFGQECIELDRARLLVGLLGCSETEQCVGQTAEFFNFNNISLKHVTRLFLGYFSLAQGDFIACLENRQRRAYLVAGIADELRLGNHSCFNRAQGAPSEVVAEHCAASRNNDIKDGERAEDGHARLGIAPCDAFLEKHRGLLIWHGS